MWVFSLVLPPEEVGIPGKFGLMAGKNSSLGGLYTVYTGATDLKKLSQMVAFRGKTSFKAWRTKACNKVGGIREDFSSIKKVVLTLCALVVSLSKPWTPPE